jgi:hypothetical protein
MVKSGMDVSFKKNSIYNLRLHSFFIFNQKIMVVGVISFLWLSLLTMGVKYMCQRSAKKVTKMP